MRAGDRSDLSRRRLSISGQLGRERGTVEGLFAYQGSNDL
jgi:hypothetical protein